MKNLLSTIATRRMHHSVALSPMQTQKLNADRTPFYSTGEDEDAEGASSDVDWDALLHINDMWVSENGLDPKNDLNGENDDQRLRTVSSERRSHMVPLFSDGTGIIGESWILGGLRGAASTC